MFASLYTALMLAVVARGALGASPDDLGSPGDARDPQAWIRYGDGLTEAKDFFEAVRAYERALRVGGWRRETSEYRAVEVKRAAAARLRDTPVPTNDLVIEPPAPIPYEPGTVLDFEYLRDQPGKVSWKFSDGGNTKAALKLSSNEVQRFEGKLGQIKNVLVATPLFNPLRGFDFNADVRLRMPASLRDRSDKVSTNAPLRADIRFSGSPYVKVLKGRNSGRISTVEEAQCRYSILVNELPGSIAHFDKIGVDSDEHPIFLEPEQTGVLGGIPVVGDDLIIHRPGVPLWVPASVEDALRVLMPKYEAGGATSVSLNAAARKSYEEYMSPAAKEKRRAEVAAERAAGREANARKLELMQHRWEEDRLKEAEKNAANPALTAASDRLARVMALRDSLGAAGLKAQACILKPKLGPIADYEIVAMGTPGCRPLVRANPDLLDSRLPRTALQIVEIADVRWVNEWWKDNRGRMLRNKPGDCVALAQILRQTNWSELVVLLGH